MHAHFGFLWEQVADATPGAPAVIQGARSHSKVGMHVYDSPGYCETNFAAIEVRGAASTKR